MSTALDERRLMLQGRPLVQLAAKRVARRLGGLVPYDDLVSIGSSALVDAARAFDPQRASFTTFASRKIEWAMLDGARKERTRRRARARAFGLTAAALAREGAPSVSDASATLEPEEAHVDRLGEFLREQAGALAAGLGLGSLRDATESAETRLLDERTNARLAAAVASLEERERALVERHYFGEEPFDAIAADLGVSKSWASRLHARAIEHLAAALRDEAG